MDNTSFGVTMTFVGMGGTFLTIGIIIVGTNVLKKIFPLPKPPGSSRGLQRGGV